MSQTVFVSHAGADSAKAVAVAELMKRAGIEVRIDRDELHLGDRFLHFMETALSTSDYCLLLWSKAASATPWVQLEWEAALHRSVAEKRSFLVLALLEDTAPPALLAPRLFASLFPDLEPGITTIIDTWLADRDAEKETQRPVGAPRTSAPPAEGPATIYVTSELFGITAPLRADLDTPAGIYLDTVIAQFGLPTVKNPEGPIISRYSYRLMNGDEPLDRGSTLASQGIKDKSVLWLETTVMALSPVQPLRGNQGPAVYRGRSSVDDEQRARVIAEAEQELLTTILRNGLGP
jgi:hypothetical protein